MVKNVTKSQNTENKCGNFGFYPKVMCTAKSVRDRWVILECLDIKIIVTNLFYGHGFSWLLLTQKDLKSNTARILTLPFVYSQAFILLKTWFLSVTAQTMGFRGSKSPSNISMVVR